MTDPGPQLDVSLFDEVADAVRAMVPAELGAPGVRARRYGIKVWFGADEPAREHYEAQVIGAQHVDGARVLAIEVGLHAEHRDEAANESVIAHLRAHDRWRQVLGDEPVAGPFLGRDGWRRVSEAWPDPDLGDPGLAFELAARLTDYVTALEPVLRAR